MDVATRERWIGGRTYLTAAGKRRWTIRKEVDGIAYDLALDVDSEEDALLEFRAFKAGPAKYAEQIRQPGLGRVGIDDASVQAFLAELKKSGRYDEYVEDCRNYLARWSGLIGGRDLRAIDAKTLKRTLGKETGQKWMTIVFKSFCSFLVKRGDLDPAEDPGRFLSVPPAHRHHGDEKAYSIETLQRLYTAMPRQDIRDVLRLQCSTGMHFSEVKRLASHGDVRDVKGYGDIAGTITFVHKTGERKVLSLDGRALAAAKRIVAAGGPPTAEAIYWAMEKVCEANQGVESVRLGALRHSFGTWLAECGEIYHPKGVGLPPEKIAEALGHTNTRTTKLHYLSVAVPPLYRVPLMRLFHPDDPVTLEARESDRQARDRQQTPGT